MDGHVVLSILKWTIGIVLGLGVISALTAVVDHYTELKKRKDADL